MFSWTLFAWEIEIALEDFSIFICNSLCLFLEFKGLNIVRDTLVSLDVIMVGVRVSRLKLGC